MEPIAKPAASSAAKTPAAVKAPAVSVGGTDSVVEMDRMRKMIADHMVMSKRVSPHVTSFLEADVTNLVLWRNKTKDAFLKREGQKLTFTPIFVEALAQAIKEFPAINVSVKDDTQIVFKRILTLVWRRLYQQVT